MPARDRRPSLEAPPSLEEPSAWQLRFGRRPTANQPDADTDGSESASRRPSPPQAPASIAHQLLQALAERERAARPELELSRECAEQLLGKRNAFAHDLRMDDRASTEVRGREDVSAAAKEIIRTRMQVEEQAEALKRAGKGRERPGRAPPPVRPVASASERLRLLREAQARREQELKTEATRAKREQRRPALGSCVGPGEPSGGAEGEGKALSSNQTPPSHDGHERRGQAKASQRTRPAAPPLPDPIAQMELRQARIREKREARRLQPQPQCSTEGRGRGEASTASRSGESDSLAVNTEEKRLQERITRLSAENQRAVELDERVRVKKRQWEAKSAAFAAWKRLVLARQDCAAHALAVSSWQTLRRFMARWRNFSVARRRERVAIESRERCVREQRLEARADAFARKTQLPRWFYRWVVTVAAARQRREAQDAAQRRRQQAQRLMERLVRGPESESPRRVDAPPSDNQSPLVEPDRVPAAGREPPSAAALSKPPSRSAQPATRGRSLRPRAAASKEGCSAVESASPPTARATANASVSRPTGPTPVDPVYASMLERAGERKERREKMRLRYERAQQEKRDTLAMQIEDRAAALVRLKEAERQRVREQKREAQAAARAKQERREQAAELLRSARASDRLRLLRYYAFGPWKFQYECRQRVATYAQSWHAMRVTHACWLQWQSLVAGRRRERRALELARLAAAACHFDASLRRRVWQAWRLRLQRIEAVGAAAERRSALFAAARAWRLWRGRLAADRAKQHAWQAAAERELGRGQRARAFEGWRRVVAEMAAEREREAERRQLWAKVRGWLGEDGA